MKVSIMLMLALLLALASAADYPAGCRVTKDKSDAQPMASYDFQWAVRDDETQVDMGQQESRKADDTNGEYRVVLPNGGRQIVNYQVNGPSGYKAQVRYEQEKNYIVGKKQESKNQESENQESKNQDSSKGAYKEEEPKKKEPTPSKNYNFTRGTEYKIVDYKTAGSSALYRRFTK